MKRTNTALFVFIVGLTIIFSALPMSAQEEAIVARINGTEITSSEFYDVLEQTYGSAVLEQMIIEELLLQKQAAVGIEISNEDFDLIYSYFVNQIGGPEALYMFLMQNGVTEEQLKEQLRLNLLIGELAKSEVTATEEEVAQWFEENKQHYDQPETVSVSHILVDSEEEALAILEELEAGADFATLAEEKSTDPGTAVQGGELGTITRGMTVPAFEETAFSLPVNEYGLAESDFGWHVILVTEHTEAKEASLSEIYDMAENDYKANSALPANEYLLQLRNEADVEIMLGL